jgi:hypothetical protein
MEALIQDAAASAALGNKRLSALPDGEGFPAEVNRAAVVLFYAAFDAAAKEKP